MPREQETPRKQTIPVVNTDHPIAKFGEPELEGEGFLPLPWAVLVAGVGIMTGLFYAGKQIHDLVKQARRFNDSLDDFKTIGWELVRIGDDFNENFEDFIDVLRDLNNTLADLVDAINRFRRVIIRNSVAQLNAAMWTRFKLILSGMDPVALGVENHEDLQGLQPGTLQYRQKYKELFRDAFSRERGELARLINELAVEVSRISAMDDMGARLQGLTGFGMWVAAFRKFEYLEKEFVHQGAMREVTDQEFYGTMEGKVGVMLEHLETLCTDCRTDVWSSDHSTIIKHRLLPVHAPGSHRIEEWGGRAYTADSGEGKELRFRYRMVKVKENNGDYSTQAALQVRVTDGLELTTDPATGYTGPALKVKREDNPYLQSEKAADGSEDLWFTLIHRDEVVGNRQTSSLRSAPYIDYFGVDGPSNKRHSQFIRGSLASPLKANYMRTTSELGMAYAAASQYEYELKKLLEYLRDPENVDLERLLFTSELEEGSSVSDAVALTGTATAASDVGMFAGTGPAAGTRGAKKRKAPDQGLGRGVVPSPPGARGGGATPP